MTFRRILWIVMLAGMVTASWTAGAPRERKPDVSFVSTPQEVVREMLKMAQVTKNDVVYDLGCGDGRIVIAAAKLYGARGVGVDIDPVRIKESNENAVKEGVTDSVKFLQQDLFELNLSEATVVTLYLLVDMNVRLRPKLFRELRPGSRVVAHEFGMEEWKPDDTRKVRDVEIYYQPAFPDAKDTYLYLWVIPANVAGDWQWTLSRPGGAQDYGMHLDQKFQEFSGNVNTRGQGNPIQEARLVGTQLSFTVKENIDGKNVVMRYNGRIDGNSIRGSVDIQGGPFAGKRAWAARRPF